MSDYRRLISYIYAYEGGVKGRNIGFAKLEARGGQCKIQVSVRRIYVGNQDVGVYLLTPDKEILVGRIFLRGGSGEFRAVVPFDNVDGSGRGMDQCYGLTIHSTDDAWRCYTTIWEDAVAHAAAVELEEATAANAEAKEMEKLPPAEITEKSLAGMDGAPRESVVESIEREIAAQPVERKAVTESVGREIAAQPKEILQPLRPEVPAAQPEASLIQEPPMPQPESLHVRQPEAPVTYPQPETPRIPQSEMPAAQAQASEIQRTPQPEMPAARPQVSETPHVPQPEMPAAQVSEIQRAPQQGTSEPRPYVPESPCVTQSEAATQPEAEASRIPQPEVSVVYPQPEALSQPQEASRQSSEGPVPTNLSSGGTAPPVSSAPSGTAPSPEGQPASQIPLPDPSGQPDRDDIGRLWSHFQRHYPKIQAFDYHGGCEILLIKPQDIGLLPRETWSYGNNSFLLHGYYNHRYLILARLSSPDGVVRFLLGVPGHYYSNEKYMASMFGFPNFVLSKMQPAGDGRFGYWYTDIKLTDESSNRA